jgi:hypothetical protein
MKYFVPLFFALISFTINAQQLPTNYIGIWAESKDNCKNDLVVNISANLISTFSFTEEIKSVKIISENECLVSFITFNGEDEVTINWKLILDTNNLKVIENEITKSYIKCPDYLIQKSIPR